MPKADATGLAPKKSATNPLDTPEGFVFGGVAGAAGPRTLLPAAKRRRGRDLCGQGGASRFAGSIKRRRPSARFACISLVKPRSGGLGRV